jgi:hypothetical protein
MTAINNILIALSKTLPISDVKLVRYSSSKELNPDFVKLKSIAYNIHTDNVEIALEVNDEHYQEIIYEELNKATNDYNEILDFKDRQILELVELLRAYQRKEEGTATKANELLSTVYENVG